MIESSLGILGACLPALRPIFRGFSPESVIRSIRSALSLDSLGSRHSKTGSERSKQPAKAIDQNGSEVELTGVHSLGSAHGESHRNETGLAKTADSDVERPHGGSVPADGIMVERSYNVV
ncbi:MAG: hypothetical protein LQ340_006035 [Diploschistes diacapsis]|nr:MAG: hypothetical protein LQ340_006035 [Diploschistes diacapsis]